ncbi:hypothetical protein [Streptomyces uncialis]|uniref:hypothetical protein n=1 Tax=Streptomyces uncialis TaxID=1048205 RepID=UPI003F634A4A
MEPEKRYGHGCGYGYGLDRAERRRYPSWAGGPLPSGALPPGRVLPGRNLPVWVLPGRVLPVRALTCVLTCLLTWVLTGCQGMSSYPGEPVVVPAPATATLAPGPVFLAEGECSSRVGRSFDEVSCGSERAAAKVVRRQWHPAGRSGPVCPGRSDFVLHLSESRPAADEDGDGQVPEGYACMRNLEPPHQGDPGGGGGPRTIVGDCLYDTAVRKVRETACDGSADRAPRYRVGAAVAERSACPPSTVLYVSLGGARPVGCAVRV